MILLTQNKQLMAVGKMLKMDSSQASEDPGSMLDVHVILSLVKIVPALEGKCIKWPKHLIAKPVRVVAPPGNHPPSNSCPEASEPLPSPVTDLPANGQEDRIFNHGLQVLQLGVFLMQLDDTEREGDGERMMRNWKMLMLFNRAGKRGKKYAFEAMRLITNCRALYSAKMAQRVIHGMFVNPKGGDGKNYANDLKQEHLVKGNKVSLHDLCGNKTLKAVTRSTQASYSQQVVGENFDDQSKVSKNSTSHTYGDCKEDVKEMVASLRNLKPFTFSPDRLHKAFPNMSKSPLDQLDPVLLERWLTKNKRKIAATPYLNDDSDSDNDDDDDDNDDDVLPVLNDMDADDDDEDNP